nr:hypothetical protein [Tanacetum cinerariifolium]
MAERKVLNKYFPPDFDPAKIPKRRKPKNRQINVRNMLPMTIRCKRCGNYSNEGTKFNMQKETLQTVYTIESGAERYSGEAMCEEKRWKRDAEERGDSMKSIENRTHGSKREIDILSNLDEIKSMNSRRAHKNICYIDDDKLDDTYNTVVSGLNGRRTSQTGSKKRKVSKSQTDFLSSTHDELNYKKEHISGTNLLKSSVIKFTPIKKSSKPKTQASEEEKKTNITSNVSKSLRQQYDEK